MSKKSKTVRVLGGVLIMQGVEFDSDGSRIDIMKVYSVTNINEKILINIR